MAQEFVWNPFVFFGATILGGIAATVGFTSKLWTESDKRSEHSLLLDNLPLILKYDGHGLQSIRLTELKFVAVNVTSDTTATFTAPTWNTTVDGDFWFDEASSTASILRGNFSFAAPPSITTSTSVPTSSSSLPLHDRIEMIRRSASFAVPDEIKHKIDIAGTAGSLLSEMSRSKGPQASINDDGSETDHHPAIVAQHSEKRAVPQSPTLITGHWMMYTHRPADVKKKEVFDAFYEHEMDGFNGVADSAKLGKPGEYYQFLSEWDEQCLKERFPLCCTHGGLCM